MANIKENNNGEKKKKTQGKLKIEIKKIEKVSNRQVTFSKRRLGLFKKASELCVLTGAEIAILVQSLTGKRNFTFGHKSVDSVIDRYLENRIQEENPEETGRDDHEIEYSSRVCKELEMKIKAEKGVVANDNDGRRFWWEMEVDELELEELERYEAALVELMNNLETKANLKIPTSDDTLMANCNQMHDHQVVTAEFDNYNPNFTSDDFLGFDVDHIWADLSFSDQYL